MAAVIAVSRLLGILCRPLYQPLVIAEVLAGILLGPSVLGYFFPAASHFLLPEEAAPLLGSIAQLGIVLYMFLIGLELNTGLLREQGRTAVVVSLAGIAVPFILGGGSGWLLATDLAPPGVTALVFALFMGVSMSITAFPVLARILAAAGMAKTPLGVLALAAAALGDALAWCVLAVVSGVAETQASDAWLTCGLAALYVAFMLLLVRPMMKGWVERVEAAPEVPQSRIALVFLGLLASALTTELIGLHSLFGAFLFGAVIPHESRLARDFLHKLEDLVGVLFLPAFFAYTGLKTQLSLLSGWESWFLCVLFIAIATVGKVSGTTLAAHACGLGWRPAATLGVLMNTRGLMELIVLNIGLELGVLSPRVYAMLVVMALVTTFATAPLVRWLKPAEEQPLR